MNREQYIEQLKALLSDISEAERTEAITYYEEYFEDADMADEDVIKQLGPVELVAESIREELADKELVVITKPNTAQDSVYDDIRQSNTGQNYSDWEPEKKESSKKESNTGLIVILSILGILASPIIIPIFMVIVGVLFAVIMTLLSILIASSACAIAFGFAAVVCLLVACVKLFVTPFASVILVGACLLCLGLCFLNILISIKMCTWIIPNFFKALGQLLSLPFQKKEAVTV